MFLVTDDDTLWAQLGTGLDQEFALTQVDSIDELHATVRAGAAAIILWDARDQLDRVAGLSHLQRHSPRLALVALDVAARADAWQLPLKHRQIAAFVNMPIDTALLSAALASAREELQARTALLGENSAAGSMQQSARPKIAWVPAMIAAVVLLIGAAAYHWYQRRPAPATAAPAAGKVLAATSPATTAGTNSEKVDELLDKARQAMLDRRFIDPADGNALAFYRDVLIIEPANGEARQGLQRLAQLLVLRVQADLDAGKIDLALQGLETARSINPGDPQFAALDARIASLRAEIGPAQIQAAINAKNFDRATQLLGEAARGKFLSAAKLAQLRDEVTSRRGQSEVSQLITLAAARLQENRLVDPRNDSAAHYLQQARAAGASPADIAAPSQELSKKLLQAARTAIDARQLIDVDRWLAEARVDGAPAAAITTLQHDLAAARKQQDIAQAEQARLFASAQSRLALGAVSAPENDSALYYLGQLRAADPKAPQLPRLSQAIQAKISAQARTALDAGDTGKAQALLALARSLGPSAELDALDAALAQRKLANAAAANAAAISLVVIKPLKVEYPQDALQNGIEGWVDLGYTVTTEGKVADVKIVNASPRGRFEAAAKAAMYRVRYKPVQKDGKAVEVESNMRVVFRLGK